METDQTFLATYLLVKGYPLRQITRNGTHSVMHFDDAARKEIEPFTLGASAPALELLRTYRQLLRQIRGDQERAR